MVVLLVIIAEGKEIACVTDGSKVTTQWMWGQEARPEAVGLAMSDDAAASIKHALGEIVIMNHLHDIEILEHDIRLICE